MLITFKCKTHTVSPKTTEVTIDIASIFFLGQEVNDKTLKAVQWIVGFPYGMQYYIDQNTFAFLTQAWKAYKDGVNGTANS
jgi:hypothetical protein